MNQLINLKLGSNMIEWLTIVFNSIQTNPIVAGLFGTTLIAGTIAYCKNIPSGIINFIMKRFTITIISHSAENSNDFSIIYRAVTKYTGHQLNFTFDCNFLPVKKQKFYSYSPVRDAYSSLAVSNNTAKFIKVQNIWCKITKIVDTDSKTIKHSTLRLVFFTRDKSKVTKILDDWYSDVTKYSDNEYVLCLLRHENSWQDKKLRRLNFNKLHITDIQQSIIDRVDLFLNHPERWYDKNMTHKEGFIFHGIAGSGKSFFVRVIADKFNIPIYYLSIGSFLDEEQFIRVFSSISYPSIILIEDIDCSSTESSRTITSSSYNKHKSKSSSVLDTNDKSQANVSNYTGLSLSSLLNVLDGVLSMDGQLVVVTTNSIEKLDAALIRAGRFNNIIEFKPHQLQDINKELSIYYDVVDSSNLLPETLEIEMTISTIMKFCSQNKTIEDCVSDILKQHNPIKHNTE